MFVVGADAATITIVLPLRSARCSAKTILDTDDDDTMPGLVTRDGIDVTAPPVRRVAAPAASSTATDAAPQRQYTSRRVVLNFKTLTHLSLLSRRNGEAREGAPA